MKVTIDRRRNIMILPKKLGAIKRVTIVKDRNAFSFHILDSDKIPAHLSIPSSPVLFNPKTKCHYCFLTQPDAEYMFELMNIRNSIRTFSLEKTKATYRIIYGNR